MMDEKQKELLKKILVRYDTEQFAGDNSRLDEKAKKKLQALIEKQARLLAKLQKKQKDQKEGKQ